VDPVCAVHSRPAGYRPGAGSPPAQDADRPASLDGRDVLGSLVGLYEHIANNIGFQLEVSPGSTIAQLISAALGGASPLLAPGILAVAAVLALAATYAYPALSVMSLNPFATEG
jgi:hypothetical protein